MEVRLRGVATPGRLLGSVRLRIGSPVEAVDRIPCPPQRARFQERSICMTGSLCVASHLR